jgi:hypothetical protein
MSERKTTSLITHPDRAFFFAQNIGRKPMIIIQNYYIDRHKAAVGE